MRLPFPSQAKRKRKPWLTSPTANSLTACALPDVLWTAILTLKASADACPPLNSTVGGVIALLEIAERVKHSKSDARAIALRTKEILDVIADAVPDAFTIPPPMLESIKRFTLCFKLFSPLRAAETDDCPRLLDEIRRRMETIALTGGLSRVMHLNRNERMLQDIKAQLDDAYRDLLAASALRIEMQQAHLMVQQAHLRVQQTQLTLQQTQLATQQAQTHTDIGKVSAATNTLACGLSRVSFYSRFTVFLADP
ncbi:hypothetical protein C8R44DRAFT_991350 [Mycena epipterygia]|nr:hypothetical protein C8R44DRAFT_991350 [Mycena epipterygia]